MTVPFDKHIGDSTPEINTPKADNWKSVGDLAAEIARRMAEKACAK
jgi:hypothetical protein